MILASRSPRRKELLKLFFDEFSIIESNYKEDNTLQLPPQELVMEHARGKARDVFKRYEKPVIAADSIVHLDGTLGKPHTKDNAREMLKKIQGRWIDVYSGICVISEKEEVDFVKTRVKMAPMSNEEIEWYISTKEPLDRAGAFAVQGKGALFVEKINGCFFNVVGLPVYRLKEMLKKQDLIEDNGLYK